MDRETVRRSAEGHVRAIVDGRIADALDDIFVDLREESSANLTRMAPLVEDARVGDVSVIDETAIVALTFVTHPKRTHPRSTSTANGGRSRGDRNSCDPSRSRGLRV
jgi:hypothetical protein